MIEPVGTTPHRIDVELCTFHLLRWDRLQQVPGQDPERQVIHEWNEGFRQGELDVFIVQFGDFDRSPEVLDILGIERARSLHPLDGEDHIVGGDGLTIVPDGVLADRKIIDRAILGDTPGFCKIGLRHAAFIELDQAAEEQAVHVTIGRVVPIQQGVKPSQGTDQSFGVHASLFRLREDRPCDGRCLLAEQQDSHDSQCHHDDQYLPA